MALTLAGLHQELRPFAQYALQLAAEYGIRPRITSVFRSIRKQAELRARFERCVREGRFPSPGPCQFPANRPGDSAHNFGLAFDSVVPANQEEPWTIIREFVGFRVPPNDVVHAEYPGWRNVV